MASIRQRGSRWQARVVRQGFPPEVKTFQTHVEAERWARSVETDMDRGAYQNTRTAERTTVAEVLTRYIEEVAPLKKGCKDEVIRLKALSRSTLAKYALSNLTATAVAKFRDDRLKVVAPGTVIRDLATLGAVFNHARREWGYLVPDVVRNVRKPRQPQGRDRVLSEAEEQSLLTAAEPKGRRSPWLYPLLVLAIETAMRRGELLTLRWEHVDLERRTAFLPDTKNGRSRLVPLSPRAIQTLRSLPRSIDGRVIPLSEAAVHIRFKLACERAGIENLRFHDLRHTATTRLAEVLCNVVELSSVTGHTSLQMLKRYYHPKAEALAAKMQRGAS